MDAICLDIKSSFGSFTTPFSTTGGLLSYKLPPKPAVAGMLGSILGMDFENTRKVFKDMRMGIKPLFDFSSKTVTFNCHYGGRPGRMVNVQQEILINPAYRLLIDLSDIKTDINTFRYIETILQDNNIGKKCDSFVDGFKTILENRLSYYNLYMGRNNFPLSFRVVDKKVTRVTNVFDKRFESDFIVPHGICSDFNLEELPEKKEEGLSLNLTEPDSLKFFIIRDLPISQNERREYVDFKDFITKANTAEGKLFFEVKENDFNFKYCKEQSDKLVVLF